jgi:hypothetical protein
MDAAAESFVLFCFVLFVVSSFLSGMRDKCTLRKKLSIGGCDHVLT